MKPTRHEPDVVTGNNSLEVVALDQIYYNVPSVVAFRHCFPTTLLLFAAAF